MKTVRATRLVAARKDVRYAAYEMLVCWHGTDVRLITPFVFSNDTALTHIVSVKIEIADPND